MNTEAMFLTSEEFSKSALENVPVLIKLSFTERSMSNFI